MAHPVRTAGIFGMLVLAAAAAPAFGQLLGGARQTTGNSNLDSARREYDRSENAYQRLRDAISVRRSELDRLLSRQAELPQLIADAEARSQQLLAEAADLEKQVPGLKTEADGQAAAAPAKRATAAQLKRAWTDAAEQEKRAVAEATAALEASPAWTTPADAYVNAEKALAAAQDAALAKLERSPRFAELQRAAAAGEAHVKSLRGSGRTDGLAAASRTWIEAKSALERVKTDALGNDPATAAARKAFDQARDTLAAVRQQLQTSIPTLPAVAAATAAAAETRKAFDAAEREATGADRLAADAKRKLDDAVRQAAEKKARSATVVADVPRLRQELARINPAINSLQPDLAVLERREQIALSDRDRAADAYAQAVAWAQQQPSTAGQQPVGPQPGSTIPRGPIAGGQQPVDRQQQTAGGPQQPVGGGRPRAQPQRPEPIRTTKQVGPARAPQERQEPPQDQAPGREKSSKPVE